MTRLHHHRSLLLPALLFVAAGVLLYVGHPDRTDWWLKCPLHLLTGWQCPFCGAQRAVHECLHGHFAAAWSYNPALAFFLPYGAALTLGQCSRRLRRSRWVAACYDRRVWPVALLLLLAWSVVRNFLS